MIRACLVSGFVATYFGFVAGYSGIRCIQLCLFVRKPKGAKDLRKSTPRGFVQRIRLLRRTVVEGGRSSLFGAGSARSGKDAVGPVLWAIGGNRRFGRPRP